MKKIIIYIFFSLLINYPFFSHSGELYSPANCEFTVEFPRKYEVKKIYLPSGETVLQASSKTRNDGRLGAECYISSISTDDFMKFILSDLTKRGVTVYNVQSRDHMGTETVVASGGLYIDGGLLYLKIVSYFGDISRLDLILVENEIASKESLNFRNSVRLKR